MSLYVKLSITMRTLLNWSNLASISLGNKSPFPVGGGPKSRNKSPGIKSPVIKSPENKSPSALQSYALWKEGSVLLLQEVVGYVPPILTYQAKPSRLWHIYTVDRDDESSISGCKMSS